MNENRALAVLLVLLAAAAAWSSFRGEVVVGGPDPLTTMPSARVERFRYQSATSTVVAERRADHWWMEVDRKATNEAFVPDQRFEEALETLTPLRPRRALGAMSPEQLSAFELEPPKIVLHFEGPSGTESVQVGDRTQVGQKDGYARRPGAEEVFIVDLAEIDSFNNAFGYRRRRLRSEGLEEVAAATVRWAEGEARARHRNRGQAKDRFWASDSEPDTRDKKLEKFMDELERLRIRAYPEPEPELTDDQALLTVTWLDDRDEPLDTMRLWKLDGPERTQWFARSDASVRTVTVVSSTARKVADAFERLR